MKALIAAQNPVGTAYMAIFTRHSGQCGESHALFTMLGVLVGVASALGLQRRLAEAMNAYVAAVSEMPPGPIDNDALVATVADRFDTLAC